MTDYQKMILSEYKRGMEKAKGPKEKKNLTRAIAERFDLTMGMVEGIAELGAVDGLQRTETSNLRASARWEPVDYGAMVEDHKLRLSHLEKKVEWLCGAIEQVLEDGRTMAMHTASLGRVAKTIRGRQAIDLEKVREIPEIELKAV